METTMSPHAKDQLGKWGLSMDDVAEVIAAAQNGMPTWSRNDGDTEVTLARKRLGKVNVYVEYSEQAEQTFFVLSVYAHRLCIAAEEADAKPDTSRDDSFPDSKWHCRACGVAVKEVPDVDISYLDTELGCMDGMRCPSCGREMIGEETVESRMYMSEQMLEAK